MMEVGSREKQQLIVLKSNLQRAPEKSGLALDAYVAFTGRERQNLILGHRLLMA